MTTSSENNTGNNNENAADNAADDNRLEFDLLFAIIKEKYGHLLSDEQLEGVRSAVNGQREVFHAIRQVKLTNDVEPFSNFKPYRGE